MHTIVNGIERGVPSVVHESVHVAVKERIAKGATNLDLMKEGLAPIGIDGHQVNLHHTTGSEPGPLAEVFGSIHGNSALHGLIEYGRSFRNDPKLKKAFEDFRSLWWQWRATLLEMEDGK